MHEVEFFFDFADAASRRRYAALAEALQGVSHRLRLRPVVRSAKGARTAAWAVACTADGDEPARRLVERLWLLQDAGGLPADEAEAHAVQAAGLSPRRALRHADVQAALAANLQAARALRSRPALPVVAIDGRAVAWERLAGGRWLHR
ncbi:hypothetical protein [Aquabacterium sp. J223]|uniref:hypothetical protein n=1 Tax=Aquabacterium sp. J223 TaxID=2898431 RepID=UPI0021AE043A|nr:hypothetical protein [Aquabacterium sp. J223]UUX95826.1 hypothetical protein LRS07_00240 [Aquabacterium sp. J223]